MKRKKAWWPWSILWHHPALVALDCDGGTVGRISLQAAPLSTTVEETPWRFGHVRGRRFASAHYDIYTTSASRSMNRHLPGFMERAHDNYEVLTNLPAPANRRRMTIYMLANRPQWAAMTRKVTAPRADLYLAIRNGGYCHRGVCVFWDMRTFSTFVLAAHEGMHQFLHYRLREWLPAWANEGLAVTAEGFVMDTTTVRFDPLRNPVRQAHLRKLLSRGGWIPLPRLLASDAGDHISAPGDSGGLDYYAQLWALMTYIRSKPEYNEGLDRMVADAAAGRFRRGLNVPDKMGRGRQYARAIAVPAFRRYIDDDVAAFEQALKAHAKKLAKLL